MYWLLEQLFILVGWVVFLAIFVCAGYVFAKREEFFDLGDESNE